MPQNRRRYYRKPPPPQPGRLQIYGQAGKQLYKDVMYLKTLINSEPHYFITNGTGNVDSLGTVLSLSEIAQGDGPNDRTGTSVLPRFHVINMHVNKKLTAVGTVDHETIRVIVFRYWGEQPSNPSVPTPSEILNALNPLSTLDEDNTGKRGERERRIEVIKSKLFTLDSVASTSRTWKWNINVNGPQKKVKEHIKWRESLGSNIPASGGFFMLMISDNASGANKSSYGYYSKLNFYDN